MTTRDSANDAAAAVEALERPDASPPPLRAIAYRSRAGSAVDLGALLAQARTRNRRDGITGLLVFDRGCFFQWFEGPPAAVARLWSSLRADARHACIEPLGDTSLPMRLFGGWDMQFGWRRGVDAPVSEGGIALAGTLLDALRRHEPAPELWHRLAGVPAPEPAALAHTADVLTEFVDRALGRDDSAAARLVAGMRRRGLSPDTLFADLFEPAARRFGDRWQDDRCSEFDIAIAMGRMQRLTRQLGETFRLGARRSGAPRSALVATAPDEPHMLALGLSSEYFWHAGWDVTCALPQDDAALALLLAQRRFDVLDLSLSSVFRREARLARLAASVQAARAASANPSLVVLASGRLFNERPEFGLLVGADASCPSAARAVPLAEALIAALSFGVCATVQGVLRDVGAQTAAKAWRDGVQCR